jgi:hypothetical protein
MKTNHDDNEYRCHSYALERARKRYARVVAYDALSVSSYETRASFDLNAIEAEQYLMTVDLLDSARALSYRNAIAE